MTAARLLSLPLRLARGLAGLQRPFAADQRGTAAVEFAYVLPLMVTLVTGGLETTNYAWTRMQVSQLALHTADHASRMAQSAVLKDVPVTEGDIADVLTGTKLEGESIDLMDRGRVILSSLQENSDGGQWIAWQRCIGRTDRTSNWGEEGTGRRGRGFPGMGADTIEAEGEEAVMFAEIYYEYEPLFPVYGNFIPAKDFVETAAFNIRDDRDLSGVHATNGIAAYRC